MKKGHGKPNPKTGGAKGASTKKAYGPAEGKLRGTNSARGPLPKGCPRGTPSRGGYKAK